MDLIKETLQHLHLGPATTFERLTMYPLLNGGGRSPDYLMLRQALAQGTVRITEVSEGGSVPQLAVANEGEQRVLIVDGEELVGAKQNRIVNVSILVPAKRVIPIPVSCVERGRWSYRSRHFTDSGNAVYAEARARHVGTVTGSLRRAGTHDANQGAVWRAISEKMSSLGASSPTDAMNDIYARHTRKIDDYVQAFRPLAGQLGAIFAVHGRPFGLDLFDSPQSFDVVLDKLVRSYALDAIDETGEHSAPQEPQPPEDFLAAVTAAKGETYPAVGLGEDVRLEGTEVVGAALVADGRVVHRSAFRSNPSNKS
jgi:hypothetical protein